MARRLFRSGKPSSSVSDFVSSKGGVALHVATSGSVFRMALAKIRHIFHRSNQGSITAKTADSGTRRHAQEQREQTQATLTQDTQRPTHSSETRPMLDAYGADTVVGPLGNTSEGAVDPASGASSTLGPVSALVGSEVDVVRQALFVAQTNTATVNIPNLNTYLQYLTRFNAVITNIANVHPYAQMALVILTSAARLLLNQDDQDRAVSHLLETLSTVYKFLLEEDTVRSFDNMKEMLGKIAQVASDAAQFIISYSETKNFWKTLGKNITSETRTKADGYVKLLNSLMQQYQDLAIQNILTNMHHVLEDLNFMRGELGLIHGGSGRDEIGRHGLCRCGFQ